MLMTKRASNMEYNSQNIETLVNDIEDFFKKFDKKGLQTDTKMQQLINHFKPLFQASMESLLHNTMYHHTTLFSILNFSQGRKQRAQKQEEIGVEDNPENAKTAVEHRRAKGANESADIQSEFFVQSFFINCVEMVYAFLGVENGDR